MDSKCRLCQSKLKEDVVGLWLQGASYRKLAEWCEQQGEFISHSAIGVHLLKHELKGDPDLSVDFLRWWFDGLCGYVEIRPIANRRNDKDAAVKAARARRSFTTKELDQLRDYLSRGYRDSTMVRCGWYFGVCLRDKPVKKTEDGEWVGGRAEDVVACPGVWADIDDHGDDGDDERIAQAERALIGLGELGFFPSAVVQSGGGRGRHVYYRFKRSADVATVRRIAAKLAVLLGSDASVAEPARIMRLPGSMHTKSGQIVQVAWVERRDEARYEPTAIETAIEEVAKALGIDLDAPEPTSPSNREESMGDWAPVPLDFVKEQLPTICPRFEAYVREPNMVSEPVWYRMGCLLKALNPASSSLFHEWSQAYDAGPGKRYNWSEAEKKFRGAKPVGVRCATFESLDPMEICRRCVHYSKNSSPATFVRKAYAAQLGLPGIYGRPGQDFTEADLPKMDGLPALDNEEEAEEAWKDGLASDEQVDPNEAFETADATSTYIEGELEEVLRERDERVLATGGVPSDYWRQQGMRFDIAADWMRNSGFRAVEYDEEKEKYKLVHIDFVRALYEDFPSYYFYSGINLYNGKYYDFKKSDAAFIKRFMAHALMTEHKHWVTPTMLNNLFTLYKTWLEADEVRNVEDAKVSSFFDTAPLFPVQNGILDVNSLKRPVMRDFSPDYLVTWQIDAAWLREWEMPRRGHWTLAMEQAEKDVNDLFREFDLSEETTTALFEAIGYSLAKFDVDEQRYFVLLGPGYNGKGTLLRLLESLFGKFVETVTLQELVENRFAASRLARASINIVADASNQTLKDTETIKKLTGNDLLTAEMKYRDAFPFRPRIKLWMASNHLPPTPDGSFGFFRRPLIFPFHRQLPMKPADWEKRLRTPEAKSYLLYLAIKHYLNMRAEGRKLTESKEMLRTRMDYWAANDIVQAAIQYGIFEFPDSHNKDRKDYVVPRALATKAIELFAEELGRKKVNTNTLLERLRGNYADIKEVFATCEDGKRRHVWEGVRLGEVAYELKRVRHVPDPRTGEMVVITSYLMDEYEAEVKKGAEAVRKRWDANKYAGRKVQ